MLKRPLSVLAAVAALSVLAGCSGNGDTTASDPSPTSAPTSASPTAPAVSCSYTDDGTGGSKPVDPPPASATVTGQVDALISTSVGDLKATLDADTTPCTVNSFVSLAQQGYFDDTPCHRLTTAGIFVLQCGDPTGTGSGGPGYSFADELSGSEKYPAGTLAMANAGPNTNGSQFFIVYADTPLPAMYTVFGTVDTDAIKAVTKVAKAGSDNSNAQGDGAPLTKVQISGVTVG